MTSATLRFLRGENDFPRAGVRRVKGVRRLGLVLNEPALLLPEDDPTLGQIIRRELHAHAVAGEDADEVLAHFA